MEIPCRWCSNTRPNEHDPGCEMAALIAQFEHTGEVKELTLENVRAAIAALEARGKLK